MASPPIIALTGRNTVAPGQWIRLSDLFTLTPTDGDAISFYRVLDSNATPGSAIGWAFGQYAQQGASYQVDGSVALSDIWIQGGNAHSIDTILMLAADKDGFSPTLDVSLVSNSIPVVAGSGTTVAVGGSVAAGSLVSYSDADGDAAVTYRFWDPAGGGHFSLNGATQASGQNIDIAAANLAGLAYVGGVAAGSETLWAQVYDGYSWSAWASWSQRTVRNTNTLSVVAAANRNLATAQWIRASDLAITVTDDDGDAPVQYRFTDTNGSAGSAQLWFGGSYVAQGGTVTVNAGSLSGLWIQGASGNATDGFTVAVNDGFGWSNAAAFNIVTRPPNHAPTVAGAGATVAVNASVAAASLINTSDADGDAITLYRFWDPAGGGVFQLGGVNQSAGQNIDVSAANIASLTYVGASSAGRETLWAQVYDGTDWSAWASWSQQTVRNGNTLPVVGVANRSLTPTQWIRAADLAITVADADNDAPVQYRFIDTNAGAGSARMWFGGSYGAQGGSVTINAADLGNLWIQGATGNGTDAFTAEVNDGFGWSNAAAFNIVTRPPNHAPTVSGTGTTVAVNASVAATSLISTSDADGDAIVTYRFWDPAGGGVFKLSGVTQAAGQNIDVAAANIANLTYTGAATAGRETLWAQVYDGTDWGAWASWSQQTVRNGNTLSVVGATDRTLNASQWIRAADLGITVTDADSDAPVQYRFTDTNATAGSARMWFGGSYAAQGDTVTINAGDFGNLWIQGATGGGTDGYTVAVNDGFGWSNTAAFNIVTRPPNRIPVITRGNGAVHIGQGTDVASLLSVSDADGDTPTLYRFWDPAGGGSLVFNGVSQASGTNLDVPANQLGVVQFFGGTTPSAADNLWVQVYDGQAWSAWASLDTTAYLPVPTAESFGTTGPDSVSGQNNTVHYGGAGSDWFTNTSTTLYAVYIGGTGQDTYSIPFTTAAASISFVFDADAGAGGGDTLNFEGFDFFQTQNSGAAIIDGTTLVLAESQHFRVVVLPNWNDPASGGIDTFTDGNGLTYDRAGLAALLAAHPASVETLTWEDLSLNGGEMRQTITDWLARNVVNEATIRLNSLRDLLRTVSSAPAASQFPYTRTRGNDTDSDYLNSGFHIFLGRQGNDDFTGLGSFTWGTAIGGDGADSYAAYGYLNVTIMDAGNSSGDSLALRADDLRVSAVIVDGRHLLVRNTANGGSVTTLLDWRDPASRIESITISRDSGDGTIVAQAYSFDQFAALIDSYSLPTYTWEQIGGVTADWNAFITRSLAQNAASMINVAPTVTDLHGSVGYKTRTPFTSLIGMQDTDGGLYQEYTVGAVSHATLYHNGLSLGGSGFTARAADLASYEVATDGTVASISLTVSATDGYDRSASSVITVNAIADQLPAIQSTGQVLTGAERRALSDFFTLSDGDGDTITRIEVGVPTGGILWRDGVRLGNATFTFDPTTDLSRYQVSGDGVATSLSVPIRAYDGWAWGTAAVTATVANPSPPPATGVFGLQNPTHALGTLGTVAAGVLIPYNEAFRLDSFVRVAPAQAASVLRYEFQAIGSNTGWAQGAYVQNGAFIMTSSSTIDYLTTSLDPQSYLHARFYSNDTEFWQVRARTGANAWTDWTPFFVTTTPGNDANYLPADNAPANGRAITVGAAPVGYDDWVGVADQDAYTFSVASAGTLHLEFSSLYDSVTLQLVNQAGGPALTGSISGAINNPTASAATVAAGGSATYALTPGDYRFTVGAAINPAYGSVVGNTNYHLAVSYQ